MNKNELTKRVIGCAIEVHRTLGPGLLESAYQQCLAYELRGNDLSFRFEHPVPVDYKGVHLDCGYRIDLWIESQLVVELKAVENVSGFHEAQILTYMKLANASLGLLINFNVGKLVNGIRRFRIWCFPFTTEDTEITEVFLGVGFTVTNWEDVHG